VFQDGKEETMDDSYPVTFSVDYPDRDLDRLTSALRGSRSTTPTATSTG